MGSVVLWVRKLLCISSGVITVKNLLCSQVLLALISPTRGEDWPGFRGPTGQGISAEKGLPTDWSKTKNVAWSKKIPGEAWSSPIVWGDRVYVTTTTDGGASCRILALARLDGTIAWDVEVCRQKTLRKEGKNSYATPTPVTDGERVYAVYNDGSIAAVTVEGKPAWVNHDVNYYSQHGLGNSPILYRDTLIMAFDGSSDGPEKGVGWQTPWDRAVILALDKKTGKEKWRGKRGPSRIAHTTPIVVTVGGRDELISTAGDVIQGFDPATVLGVGGQREDRHIRIVIEVDDPRTAAFAATLQAPPQFPYAARSGNQVACRRVIRQVIHQQRPLLVADQLASRRQKLRRLNDGDRNGSNHPEY